MFNDDQKGTSAKRKKSGHKEPGRPWLQGLESCFLLIAVITAVVAFFSLLAWSLISFSVLPRTYSLKTDPMDLNNGQSLQIEYPNVILGGTDPAKIKLIVSGKANQPGPITFQVHLPSGLIMVEPVDLAGRQVGLVKIEEPEKMTAAKEFTLGVINSQSVWDFGRLKPQIISVQSDAINTPIDFNVNIETVAWMSARGLVNNTFNERSPLILLVTGFLSGAGALMFQYIKFHRDNVRDSRQKRENDFRDQLDKNFLETLNRFIKLDRDERESSDFSICKPLVEGCGWEHRLQQIILEKLKNKDSFESKRAANILRELCSVFGREDQEGQANQFEHLVLLCDFCQPASVDDPKKHELKLVEADHLLVTYRRWPELRPVVTGLIHDLTCQATNLPMIYEKLATEKEGQLLREANIQKNIDDHLQKLTNDDQADPNVLTATENINKLLVLEIQWRDIRSRKERKLPDKVQRWLSGHFFEPLDSTFSLGSEYTELDGQLSKPAIEHPVFKQIDGPFPVIVFGDEGMGKTVTALWLAGEHQKPAESGAGDSKIFPVYAPFERGVDLKQWMVETISRALTDFTADNPRKFITASESQKTAMGRLMFWHAQSADALRLNFYSSPFDNPASDIEQVLDYITRFRPRRSMNRLAKDEMLNLLNLARPDIFDQIYFLWDIRSSSPLEEVTSKIREMVDLADHLARRNVFIKIFAPLAAKQALGDLGSIHRANNDLTWSEAQLKDLVAKKMMEKFSTLWDKSVEDPVELIVRTAEGSPRRLIRLLILLMDHVDKNFDEGDRLKQSDFEQVRLTLMERK